MTHISPIFNVAQVRKDFPNLHILVHGRPLVYLDNAATTFKPQTVIDAIEKHYKTETANVHRGVHYLSEKATAEFEGARDKIKNFIHAKQSCEVIFTRGTTESINLVAHSYGRHFLKEGDEIIISEMEHHSNIVPWQMLCEEKGCKLKIIPFNDAGELLFDEFKKLLNSQTKLVSVVYVSNSLGTINPVKEIITEAHKLHVPVLIDAAQAVTYHSIDVQELDCDFLAFSGHKLFGPTGIGVLYGKASLLNTMPPYQGGGDMISKVTFEKTTYNVLPYKFEAGTPNVADAIGLGAAIDYLQTFGLDNTLQHKKELLDYGTQALQSIPGVKIIGTAQRKTSILSFTVDGIHAHDIGTLVDNEGVAIRTGHHCNQPVMQHFHIPATSRASLAFYNTKEEIDKLVKAVYKAKKVFE